MKTDELFYRRFMGWAAPENYVDWAVDLLVDGADTPSLRILAGLNPRLEHHDIHPYFLKACNELDLLPIDEGDDPKLGMPYIRRLYFDGKLTPERTLHDIGRITTESKHAISFLVLLSEAHDLFGLYGDDIGSLKKWMDGEWELYDLAAGLDLPADLYRYLRCEQCGHIGLPRKLGFFESLAALGEYGYAANRLARCSKCRSADLKHMGHLDVQEDFFLRLRSAKSEKDDPTKKRVWWKFFNAN